MKDLKKRLISSLVVLVVAMAAILFGSWAFFAFILVLSFLISLEFDYMRGDNFRSFLLCAVPLLFAHEIELALALTLAGAALPLIARRWWMVVSVLYVTIPAVCIIWLRGQDYGLSAVLWIIFVVIGTDVGAYFAGNFFGKKKLAPRISPNKTWEGLYGGIVVASIMGFIFSGFSFAFLVFGAAFAVLEQASDLMQSAIKRHFNLKDSGNIIPGHGGVMDRMDGLVLTVPAVVILTQLGVLVW